MPPPPDPLTRWDDSVPATDEVPVAAPSTGRARGMVLSYAVLALGLTLTTLVTWTFARAVHDREAMRLESQAIEAENRVRNRLGRHISALLGGASLFAVDARVSGPEFRNFTDRLVRFGGLTGMQGVGFARRVEAEKLRAYEFDVRQEVPGFRVWPEGQREEYFVIEFLEPRDWRNDRAIGYDMFAESTRRDAMARARDTGEPTMTGRVRLVQETTEDAQYGFLLYAPAYSRGPLPNTVEARRKSLTGFVFAPYRARDLLSQALTDADRERFVVSLYEGKTPVTERALFEGQRQGDERLISQAALHVGGQTFTMRTWARPDKVTLASWGGIIVGAALGIVVSLLLFTITRFQVTARVVAEGNASRLRQARAEAVRNLRTRDAFLSIASHELKTPLTALQLQVDGLYRSFSSNRPLDQERLQRRLESVRRQARRLAGLVDDLLDVSRLASGRLSLTPEPVNLAGLVAEVLLRFETEAHRVGSELRVSGDDDGRQMVGLWDPARLDQVITNVIANALKYGAGKPVDVRLRRQADWAEIEVQDHGIGIAAEDQERIFRRFERAVPDRNFGGFGLGLWISQEIVRAMGGNIRVTSRAGAGATFTIALPVHQPGETFEAVAS